MMQRKLDDFTHNNKYIRIKCPECLHFIKLKNHAHVYKNTSGLWWHIINDHKDISELELMEIEEILRKISIAVHLGMLGF